MRKANILTAIEEAMKMLEQVLRHLRNWFVVHAERGEYTIAKGSISLPFLRDGQYFRIIGSIFNDGVYKYGGDLALTDETFCGAVWALAVPPALLEVVERIEAWDAKYAEAAASPYTSESFGGYSYTKAGGADGQGADTWQQAFRAELNAWRKI